LVNKINKIFNFFLILLILTALAGFSYAGNLTIMLTDSLPDNDSVMLETQDTIVKTAAEKKSKTIDEPVFYHAKDSNINLIQEQLLILYKEAKVQYDDIELTADYIRINMKNREVIAYGMTDSVGEVTGKPIFVQDGESFAADTIRYNFDTKKGIIKNVTSEFDGAYLHGSKTKRHNDETIHLVNGKFTTCDLDHPHFYFNLTKAKVIPEDKVVSGPAFLVIEDIPTPLGIPFGFFPNKKGATSGVIIPEYGEEISRGFFLRNGGYYWAINDYLDLLATGDIYSKGSWGAGLRTNYKVRYKMSGALSFNYNANVEGYDGFENYNKNQLYKFRWIHKQDRNAHPSRNFSASVDMSSSAYDKYNSINPNNYMSNAKKSSVNLSKVWLGTPFSFNMSLLHSQNNRDSSVTMTLPDMNFSMSRVYLLKRKHPKGKERFYEKIGLSYSLVASNQVTTHEDSLFSAKFDDFRNGVKHSIPISSNFKLFNYITISPYFNYNERWYFNERNLEFDIQTINPVDSSQGVVVESEIDGFNRIWDFKTGASMSTKIYGMFNFNTKRLKAIRHVITPGVNMVYYPDFSSDRFHYYADYISDLYYDEITGQYDTISKSYDRFSNGVYGSVPRGGAGSLRFSLANNLEAKVTNPNDTTGELKKIKLLESFSLNGSYNALADSLNWAPVSMAGRTRIGKLNLNFNAEFDPYAYRLDSLNGKARINTSQFKENGKIARLTRASVSSSIRFSADGLQSENKNADGFLYGYPHSYVDFSIPWSIGFNYSLNYSKPYDEHTITQTLGFNGDVNLTKKWKITYNSSYDFVNNKLSYTNIEIHRDLHCWEMSLSFVPFGVRQYYGFKLNVKSALLQDLKLQRKQNWRDNL
jgi:hypothetical protein